MQFIICIGGVVDGLRFSGPFDNAEAAIAWAEQHVKHESWVVAELEFPLS